MVCNGALRYCCYSVCSIAALETPITTFCDRSSSLSETLLPLICFICVSPSLELSSSSSGFVFLMQYLIVYPGGVFCLSILDISQDTMNRLCPLFILPFRQRAVNRGQGATVGKLAFKYVWYVHSFSSKPPSCPRTAHPSPPYRPIKSYSVPPCCFPHSLFPRYLQFQRDRGQAPSFLSLRPKPCQSPPRLRGER